MIIILIFYARGHRLIRGIFGSRGFALFWVNFLCYYRGVRCICLQYCVRGRVWPLGFRESSFYFHFIAFIFLPISWVSSRRTGEMI